MALSITKVTASATTIPTINQVVVELSDGTVLKSLLDKKHTQKLFDAWDNERQMEFDFIGGA